MAKPTHPVGMGNPPPQTSKPPLAPVVMMKPQSFDNLAGPLHPQPLAMATKHKSLEELLSEYKLLDAHHGGRFCETMMGRLMVARIDDQRSREANALVSMGISPADELEEGEILIPTIEMVETEEREPNRKLNSRQQVYTIRVNHIIEGDRNQVWFHAATTMYCLWYARNSARISKKLICPEGFMTLTRNFMHKWASPNDYNSEDKPPSNKSVKMPGKSPYVQSMISTIQQTGDGFMYRPPPDWALLLTDAAISLEHHTAAFGAVLVIGYGKVIGINGIFSQQKIYNGVEEAELLASCYRSWNRMGREASHPQSYNLFGLPQCY